MVVVQGPPEAREGGLTGKPEVAKQLGCEPTHPPVGIFERSEPKGQQETRVPLNPPKGSGNLQS